MVFTVDLWLLDCVGSFWCCRVCCCWLFYLYVSVLFERVGLYLLSGIGGSLRLAGVVPLLLFVVVGCFGLLFSYMLIVVFVGFLVCGCYWWREEGSNVLLVFGFEHYELFSCCLEGFRDDFEPDALGRCWLFESFFDWYSKDVVSVDESDFELFFVDRFYLGFCGTFFLFGLVVRVGFRVGVTSLFP